MLAAMLAEDDGFLDGFSLIAIVLIAVIAFAVYWFIARR